MFVACEPGDPPILSSEVISHLSLYIKYGHLEYGDGSIGPLVFILQWPSVPKGKYIEIEIPGLTNTTDRTKKSKVYLCDSRQGNASLWKTIFMVDILPNMKERMLALDLEVSGLTIDGDALTLNQVMSDEVLAQCKAQNTRIGKHGAARSSTDQASDACKGGFRGVKSSLNKVIVEQINTDNPTQRERMLKLFRAAIVNTAGCEEATMPLDYMRRLIDSLITITYAMANSSAFHPAVIAESFVIVGEQCPRLGEIGYVPSDFPVLGGELMTFNPEKMLRRTKGEVKDSEMKIMIDAIPEAMSMLDESGTLTREQMDHLGVPRLREGTPLREELQHCRHGAEILTKDIVYEWVKAFRGARRVKTPEEIAALSEAAATAKAIADAQKRRDGETAKIEKARLKIIADTAEKSRVSLLTLAQKKVEKQLKDAIKAKNAQDKTDKKKAQQEIDDALLANEGDQEAEDEE